MAENFIFDVPLLRAGRKIPGKVLKNIEGTVYVDCLDGVFTGVILPREVKDLERNNFQLLPGRDVEVEIVDTSLVSDDGQMVVSITKLLQQDVWADLLKKSHSDQVMTVVPTEANLGGMIVDMHGIKGFIPLSQLSPIHYPRVEDGDDEMIFARLLALVGKELKVRIVSIDEIERRIILSEREALREERDEILKDLEVGKIYDGVVSGISSYGAFVTIGGSVEGLVHISEITYGHVNDISKIVKVGDEMQVKVIGYDNGKISLSAKQIKEDPWVVIPRTYKIGDVIEGQVIRFVPYGVFIRVYDDINGLIHLSELSQESINNPHEIVKLGQMLRAKIILLDAGNRKIGLSVKALQRDQAQQAAA